MGSAAVPVSAGFAPPDRSREFANAGKFTARSRQIVGTMATIAVFPDLTTSRRTAIGTIFAVLEKVPASRRSAWVASRRKIATARERMLERGISQR